MSHQAGIKACDDLKKFFATCKDGHIRLMKIGIKNEELVLEKSLSPKGSYDEDWDTMVVGLLEEKQPTYLLVRLDETNASGHLWVFISYSPDFSPVRQKMLYAATKATLRNEFGLVHIKDELFGTIPQDVNLNGYKKHVVSGNAPKPLTMAEEELEIIKKTEVHADIGIDTKHQTVQGVGFPLSDAALKELKNFHAKKTNYIQLSLDIDKEVINVENSDSTDVNKIKSKVPKDHPRYHLFAFKHTHEGDELNSIVFLYTMPGYSCSIKERMLYSTCKSSLLNYLEKDLMLEIARKLEIDDANDISSENIYNEIHPAKNIARKQFDKPKGPSGRGPKRISKPVDDQ